MPLIKQEAKLSLG